MIAILDLNTGFLSDNRLGKRELKVLIAIAAHKDHDTNECWPSRTRLSELTGILEVNISTSTSKLVELGYLKKKVRKGRSNIYQVLQPEANLKQVSKPKQVSKEIPRSSHFETGQGIKTDTHNKPVTDQEQTKAEKWSQITFARFKKLKNKPDYSEEFNGIWKNYKMSCANNNSEEGSKLYAWFCMLQRLDSGLDRVQIELALKVYITKITKVRSKLMHLSTFFHSEELINQYLDENQDDEQKFQSAKIEGFEDRFR